MRYLIISNGCGAGHAVRDLVLADEIRRRSDGAEIYFASYAAGLSVFHSIGETVIDLKQEERPDPDAYFADDELFLPDEEDSEGQFH